MNLNLKQDKLKWIHVKTHLIKLLKTKDEDQNFENSQREGTHYFQTPLGVSADFLCNNPRGQGIELEIL